MRIGELAQRSGLRPGALRFYEQAGVLAAPARGSGGYRDYDRSALNRLDFVRAAQNAGLSLAEIRRIIELRDEQGPPCSHVVDLLDRHLADLDERIAALKVTREQVRRLRRRAPGLDPARCDIDAVCHVLAAPRLSSAS